MTVPASGFMMVNGGSSCLPLPPDVENQTVSDLVKQSESNLKEGNLYYVVSNRYCFFCFSNIQLRKLADYQILVVGYSNWFGSIFYFLLSDLFVYAFATRICTSQFVFHVRRIYGHSISYLISLSQGILISLKFI